MNIKFKIIMIMFELSPKISRNMTAISDIRFIHGSSIIEKK